MSDWKKDGVEHLERPGCIINIRKGLENLEGQEVTSIEILPDSEWVLEGRHNNRVTKVDTKSDPEPAIEALEEAEWQAE